MFKKLFKETELAKLTPEEMRTYEESLKVYRDNYPVIETAKSEGRLEGRQEERLEMARGMKDYQSNSLFAFPAYQKHKLKSCRTQRMHLYF